MTFLRIGGPHRLLLPLLVGWSAASQAGTFAFAAGLGAAIAAGLACFRVWLLRTDHRADASLFLAAASSLVTAAVVMLIVTGRWSSAILSLVAAGWLSLYHLLLRPRWGVVVEVEALVEEGLLLPLLGVMISGGPLSALFPIMALLAPLGAAGVASVFTHEPLRVLAGVPTVGAKRWAAGATLAVCSAVIVVANLGVPLRLRPEEALFVSSVSILALVIGWLMLADPRREWRDRRVRLLVTGAILSFEIVLIVVLSVR